MGINENDTIIDFHGLLSIHMPPYYNAIIEGVSTIMHVVSFSSWNGVKLHANHFLVADFLKNNRLKFKGFIISDWEGLEKLTNPRNSDKRLSVKLGVLPGIDMVSI
ncbi:uncharacterized protein LOC144560027 [Carex rostrata]